MIEPGSIVAGVDIGDISVRSVLGRVLDGASPQKPLCENIEIIGVGTATCHGWHRGEITHMEALTDSLVQSVHEAELMSGVAFPEVRVGIMGPWIQSMESHGMVPLPHGEVQLSDVSRVVEAAQAVALPSEREILHVIPQKYAVDHHENIDDPVGLSGVRLEAFVHIVTAQKTHLQHIVKCVQRAGLRISELVLGSLAGGAAVLTEEEKKIGVSLIAIGGHVTNLAIFKYGRLVHTAHLPVGGQHITNDLALGLRLAPNEAEQVKRQYGCFSLKMVG